MPNTLGNNLNLCFSIIKRPQPQPQILHISNPLPPTTTTTTSASSDDTDMADYVAATILDLTAAYASRRFFISYPGKTNSIVDSLSPSDSEAAEVAGAVPVQTYSPDPYVDFRRSMQEMVEARDLRGGGVEAWDYLQELLLRYLSLNHKSNHKYIVGAFADLLFSLMSNDHINNASSSSSLSSSSSSSCAAVDGDSDTNGG